MSYVFIGLAAGVLSGLFGIGGGVLIVPALIYFTRMRADTATGTSLGALLLPVGVLGALSWWQRGHVDVRASLWIALGLAVGAWFGAQIGVRLPVQALQRGFAVFLVAVAVQLWVKA